MLSLFDSKRKSTRAKTIERVLLDNKAEAVAQNSVSTEQVKELKPEYDALVAKLNAKDILAPSMLEFAKGVNTVEMCECRDYAIKKAVPLTIEE